MAVPTTKSTFALVTSTNGQPAATWWANLAKLDAVWSDPDNSTHTILLIGGEEHCVAHTISEIGTALDNMTERVTVA